MIHARKKFGINVEAIGRWATFSGALSRSFLLTISIGFQLIFGLHSAVHGATSAPEECYRAARLAAHETQVPLEVLLAIARTETGRSIGGKVQPWPWAINFKGEGGWLSSEAELLEKALSLIASGERLFDLGCFQLNYHWHSDGFESLDAMISPRSNALYAARFLKSLHAEFGDWVTAAGAYHSRTESLAASYTAKFLRHYENPEDSFELAAQRNDAKPRKQSNSYPLLQSSAGAARLGSLVPSVSP